MHNVPYLNIILYISLDCTPSYRIPTIELGANPPQAEVSVQTRGTEFHKLWYTWLHKQLTVPQLSCMIISNSAWSFG